MDSISYAWENYVKPNACAAIVVAFGVSFATPYLGPSVAVALAKIPAVGPTLSRPDVVAALLAAGYVYAGNTVCINLGVAKAG
jgi:hypothetical protein